MRRLKKGVSWALRGAGRRNASLHKAALEVAHRLIESTEPAARCVGRDAVKDLSKKR
ncbi:MAG TPA: hypothetical protein VEK79_20820 [Thermoanaerobaculia bacterium]|nr:hypothetical protein [Thermoanaerobaculia bacterium]